MDRNVQFSKLEIASIALHLAWSTLEVVAEDVPELQLFVSGSDGEVASLKVEQQDGKLLIEQPAYGISSVNVMEGHWMNVFLRIPTDWKGSAEMITTSGRIQLRGISGSDLTVDSVSGIIRVDGLQCITLTFNSVSGRVNANGLNCEQLSLRTVTGPVQITDSAASVLKLYSVSSDLHVSLRAPFDSVSATTVTGNLVLDAPITAVKPQLTAVTGHQHLFGVSADENGAAVVLRSVSGDLEITGIPASN